MTDLPPIEEELPKFIEELLRFDNAQDFWDYPPMLYIATTPSAEEPDKYRVHMIPTSSLFEMATVPHVLHVIGAALTMPDAPTPAPFEMGEGVLAVILRSEGWGLRADGVDVTQESVEEWQRAGKSLVDHPKAIETKSYSAYSAQTGAIMAACERPTKDDVKIMAFEGAINDGLKEIFDACTMRWPVLS